ncbi:MAG: DpnD/PcfM family protein [Oscillospiraceae bacterium]|nr:DpnD/PcfM family protein [Oscillospiraceae bacterium]
MDKLDAAKEKSALREFEVTITETLRMTVTVTARDQCEAEEIVSENWNNGEYILDADHFVNADFEAAPVKRESPARGTERS